MGSGLRAARWPGWDSGLGGGSCSREERSRFPLRWVITCNMARDHWIELVYEILFTYLTPRWQNIEMGVSRSAHMTTCSHMVNWNQVDKPFNLSQNMLIHWTCMLIMYILCMAVYTDHVITAKWCIFLNSDYRELYSPEETFRLIYYMSLFKRTYAKSKFLTMKMYKVGSLYPHKCCLRFSRFATVETFTQLLESNRWIYKFHIFGTKFFQVSP